MDPQGFLSLPAEIRVKVYQHLIPTAISDRPTFEALRLVSKRVKSEYEHETEVVFKEYFKPTNDWRLDRAFNKWALRVYLVPLLSAVF